MVIIIRYSEIALKGKNRITFERKLVSNIKKALDYYGIIYSKVQRTRNRILVHTEDACMCLKNVFGIASFSNAIETRPEFDSITKKVDRVIKDMDSRTSFRVTTKNLSAKDIRTQQMNADIGSYVVNKKDAPVNLTSFDLEICIEFINTHAYIFTERIKGFFGLPVGTQGKVSCIIENEASVLSAWLMLKRGCSVALIHYKHVRPTILKDFVFGSVEELTVQDFDELIRELKARDGAFIINETMFEKIRKEDPTMTLLNPVIAYKKRDVSDRLEVIFNEMYR